MRPVLGQCCEDFSSLPCHCASNVHVPHVVDLPRATTGHDHDFLYAMIHIPAAHESAEDGVWFMRSVKTVLQPQRF